MSAHTRNVISIISTLIVMCIKTKNTASQYLDTWVVEEWSCITPGGTTGYCISVRNCQPVVDFIMQLSKSQALTQDATEFLRRYTCGYEDNSAKVCCPFAPIILPKHPIVPDDKQQNTTVPDDNHPNMNLLSSKCGFLGDENRVLNGEKAGLFEFPWMALLSYDLGNGGRGFRCGGTIINDRYVLTAAHCITNLGRLKLVSVRFGEHDINSTTDCAEMFQGESVCAPPVQDLSIEEIIPHPDYSTTTHENDIGLIRLASAIDTTQENSKPICLPITSSLRSVNLTSSSFTITGWGLTGRFQSTTNLLKINVPGITEEDCRKAYENTNVIITASHICAGSKTADACKGDSGGPLQRVEVYDDDVRYVQYGVVSLGPKVCGDTQNPGVYTKVDRYVQWILDTIKP